MSIDLFLSPRAGGPTLGQNSQADSERERDERDERDVRDERDEREEKRDRETRKRDRHKD